MKATKLRRFLLLGCVIFSVVIHGGLLFLFFKTPFFLRQRLSSFWFKSNDKPDLLVKNSKVELPGNVNRVLEESFNHLVAVNAQRPKVVELKEEEVAYVGVEEQTDQDKAGEEELFAREEEAPFSDKLAPSDSFSDGYAKGDEEPLFEINPDKDFLVGQSFKQSEELDFAEELRALDRSSNAKELVDDFSTSKAVPSSQASSPRQPKKEQHLSQFLKDNYKSMQPVEEIPAEISYEEVPASNPAYVLANPGEYLREEWTSKSITESKLPDIEYYGIAELASAILWEEDIAIDVSYISDPEQHKYVFSLTINPDFDLEAEPLQQNFYFIIDRSNSIKKQRFNSFKRAVQRALSGLQEGDKFNIYILDKTISRLSEKNLFVSAKNLKLAEEFLEKEDYKPFFSGNDLYDSLDRLFAFTRNSEELHSAVLISDGNTLLSSSKQKKAIFSWSEKNQGNVNLYTATSGQGNNLVLLDLLSYTTAGKFLYSDTNASFPRKLVKLVKDLHDPIVKEVSIEAVATDSGNHVHLYPSKTVLSPLHMKKPFVVVGTVDDLEDFTLYIQGRNRGRWLNIKKKISFQEAVKGGRSLEKLWAQAQANACYDQFLKEGKTAHLKEAKKILTPYKATICLEQ